MYIIELIWKLKQKKKNEKNIKNGMPKNNVRPEENEEKEEKCVHTFAPLDSTKRYFACTKCGYIVDIKKIKKEKNFFLNN